MMEAKSSGGGNMYKTEAHLHTAEGSLCGKLPAAEMVKQYHEAGYTTLLIADHFGKDVVERIGAATWEQTVAIFFAGYTAAKEAAKQYGMYVLPSPEFAFAGNVNHYLACGAGPAFFLAHPEVADMNAAELHRLLNENGLMLIQAHPYRAGQHCVPDPENVDALEVINGHIRHFNPEHEVWAREVAAKHGLGMTVGSDAHAPQDVARTAVLSNIPITTVEEYFACIFADEVSLLGPTAE